MFTAGTAIGVTDAGAGGAYTVGLDIPNLTPMGVAPSVIDDLIIYDRGDNEVVVVINACCLESDTEWIKSQLEPDIEVIDYKKDGVFLAVQGKDAIDILEKCLDVKFKKKVSN